MSRDEVSRDDAIADDRIAPIILAAGAGSRFRDIGHKLNGVLPASGSRPAEPVALRCIATAVEAALGTVTVVTGRLAAVDLGLGDDDDTADGIRTVHNSAWADGQMTSVHVGIADADARHADVAVIGLADQPGIAAQSWRDVAAACAPSTPIAVATYAGRRANPVALHRSIWTVLPQGGDEGARSLMRLHPHLVCEVPCSGSPDDIDTAEDLRRWQSS